ncbi:MAG: hypothetical protein IT380_24365 [Myxococcales bacterium]|nr:hypothetical protein [Myxococcales bacterium]
MKQAASARSAPAASPRSINLFASSLQSAALLLPHGLRRGFSSPPEEEDEDQVVVLVVVVLHERPEPAHDEAASAKVSAKPELFQSRESAVMPRFLAYRPNVSSGLCRWSARGGIT